jgi:carboxylesterase
VITPVLLIHAREDDVTSLRSPQWVESVVGSKLVRSIVLDDSYHMVTLDNQRDVVARETLQFFDFVARRSSRSAAVPQGGALRGTGT